MQYRNVKFKKEGNLMKFSYEGSKRVIMRETYRLGTMYRTLPTPSIDPVMFAKTVIDELYNRMQVNEKNCLANKIELLLKKC